ncbi:molybdate ABC transporter permease subunit [Burkholderiaceae bacterium FT117]|uniref:molybdate ABC transporter permease subunit n=1 Tax=Zeimonas sediminis TaxID=2944268 RepID=UPI002343166A|nr:molybdate ABC transporter permease subunit [Zeimonas sediminis]MCM5569304.1 molybdate ABC transporter permease subunit [Zeimonas sediminis]
MDWVALKLSLWLAFWTLVVLLPIGLLLGRWLAVSRFAGKGWIEALLALPLVLPPTVLGYYLLVGIGAESAPGALWESVFGKPLAFSFEGLVAASVLFNLPFAVQPMQRGFEAIPRQVREAAACCGLTWWRALCRIELPLAWPGILTALVMTFAHTLGEFGIVLMVGGNIPGETQTIAIAIYDRVQGFDDAAAARMSATLLAISLAAIAVSYVAGGRLARRHG